jgi:hypothetical protein
MWLNFPPKRELFVISFLEGQYSLTHSREKKSLPTETKKGFGKIPEKGSGQSFPKPGGMRISADQMFTSYKTNLFQTPLDHSGREVGEMGRQIIKAVLDSQ